MQQVLMIVNGSRGSAGIFWILYVIKQTGMSENVKNALKTAVFEEKTEGSLQSSNRAYNQLKSLSEHISAYI